MSSPCRSDGKRLRLDLPAVGIDGSGGDDDCSDLAKHAMEAGEAARGADDRGGGGGHRLGDLFSRLRRGYGGGEVVYRSSVGLGGLGSSNTLRGGDQSG